MYLLITLEAHHKGSATPSSHSECRDSYSISKLIQKAKREKSPKNSEVKEQKVTHNLNAMKTEFLQLLNFSSSNKPLLFSQYTFDIGIVNIKFCFEIWSGNWTQGSTNITPSYFILNRMWVHNLNTKFLQVILAYNGVFLKDLLPTSLGSRDQSD